MPLRRTTIALTQGSYDTLLPDLLEMLLRQDEWSNYDNFTGWTAAVAGSGATGAGQRYLNTETGSTASSTASLRTVAGLGHSSGQLTGIINWSKRVVVVTMIRRYGGSTNGVQRFTLGKNTSSGVGALATKGIGIQIENAALKGICHNGTDLTTTASLGTLTENRHYRVWIVADGAGNVEWFVDGTSQATSTGGPTGASTANDDIFQLESANGADASQNGILLSSLKIMVAQ